MLSQFNQNPDYPEQRTLPTELKEMGVKPMGRLDYDSEGLLLLSDDPHIEKELMHPEAKKAKTYLVQVQGRPDEVSLDLLCHGGLVIRVSKKDHICAPAIVKLLSEAPDWLWARTLPVEASAETSWLELTLTEGKNRQVRRMTAKVGYPTLRLIRTDLANHQLGTLTSGEWILER